MAQTVPLYIVVSEKRLITGISGGTSFSASSIPLFFGDTITLKVYLLERDPAVTQINATNPYRVIDLSGLSLQLYIDNGLRNSPTIYADVLVFTTDATDPTKQFFTADLPLNTTPLQTLVDQNAPNDSQAYLKVAYFQNSKQTTILSALVNIGIGVPSSAPTPPAGQTALTVEVANGTYAPLQPSPGQPRMVVSPSGKKMIEVCVDNPDGTFDVVWQKLST